jgi:hypothetical protein
LNAVKYLLVDQGHEVAALRSNAIFRHINDVDVQLILEQDVERLRTERFPASRPQAKACHFRQCLLLRVSPGREFLERPTHERRALWIFDEALAGPPWRVQVPDRREERPPSQFKCRSHAGFRAIRSHIVIELRERGEDAFHQLACRGVVDRFCRRAPRDTE